MQFTPAFPPAFLLLYIPGEGYTGFEITYISLIEMYGKSAKYLDTHF